MHFSFINFFKEYMKVETLKKGARIAGTGSKIMGFSALALFLTGGVLAWVADIKKSKELKNQQQR